MLIDTTALQGQDQRQTPIETMGLVIGTASGVPYIHLQLETARRMYGPGGLPILVVNDGEGEGFGNDELKELCEEYGAEFRTGPCLGHSTGDLRATLWGLDWADKLGIDLLVKFSRRFIPLVPWRHQLTVLASENRESACFTRRHGDRPDGLFRTDAIAFRVRKWRNDKVNRILGECLERHWKNVSVEPLILSLAKQAGGWAMWDLLGPDFYRPYAKAMQWRGLTPHHYADLSRWYGLSYTDEDFILDIAGTIESSVTIKETGPLPAPATEAKVLSFGDKEESPPG